MSYQGYDKWEAYPDRERIDGFTLKELKYKLKKHIMETTLITMATNQYHEEDYEITNIKLTIKKVKK